MNMSARGPAPVMGAGGGIRCAFMGLRNIVNTAVWHAWLAHRAFLDGQTAPPRVAAANEWTKPDSDCETCQRRFGWDCSPEQQTAQNPASAAASAAKSVNAKSCNTLTISVFGVSTQNAIAKTSLRYVMCKPNLSHTFVIRLPYEERSITSVSFRILALAAPFIAAQRWLVRTVVQFPTHHPSSTSTCLGDSRGWIPIRR